MSLFPRNFHNEFSPIFRLMDDYANLTRSGFPEVKSLRTFQPKFDVSETKEGYSLHGELPGIDQKNVNIEWSDGNTLTISGRTESRYESGPDSHEQGRVTEAGEENKSHQPTVEDEAGASTETPKETSTEVTTTNNAQEVSKASAPKYWVSERSVGEFHRSFSFPARVDQDGVKASLKNGILEIFVPKAAKPVNKKISIGIE
jgi:HSP20 family molecular chaperone IbpA